MSRHLAATLLPIAGALLAVAAGCGGSSPPPADPGPQQATELALERLARRSEKPRPRQADVAHFPESVTWVAGSELAKLRASKLWPEVAGGFGSAIGALLETSGNCADGELFGAITVGAAPESQGATYFALHAPRGRSAVATCLKKAGVTIEEEGPISVYSAGDGSTAGLWKKDVLLIAAAPAPGDLRALQPLLESPQGDKSAVSAAASRAPAKSALWFAGTLDLRAGSPARGAQVFYGGANLGERLTATAALVFASSDEANAAAAQLEKLPATLEKSGLSGIEGVQVRAEGWEVKLTGSIDFDFAANLLRAAGPRGTGAP